MKIIEDILKWKIRKSRRIQIENYDFFSLDYEKSTMPVCLRIGTLLEIALSKSVRLMVCMMAGTFKRMKTISKAISTSKI